MIDPGFAGVFDRLNEGVREVGEVPVVGADEVSGVVSTRYSEDGCVEVEVCDGLVTKLEVAVGAASHPRFWLDLKALINDALSENQTAVLEELRRVSLPYDRLARVLDHTAADVRAAIERTMRNVR